jgi:hypothetical protein
MTAKHLFSQGSTAEEEGISSMTAKHFSQGSTAEEEGTLLLLALVQDAF